MLYPIPQTRKFFVLQSWPRWSAKMGVKPESRFSLHLITALWLLAVRYRLACSSSILRNRSNRNDLAQRSATNPQRMRYPNRKDYEPANCRNQGEDQQQNHPPRDKAMPPQQSIRPRAPMIPAVARTKTAFTGNPRPQPLSVGDRNPQCGSDRNLSIVCKPCTWAATNRAKQARIPTAI